MQTREGVSNLHLRVLATLRHKTVVAQVSHLADAVGQPAEQQAVIDHKVACRDALHVEEVGLATTLGVESFAKIDPIATLGILSQHVERMERDGIVSACRVTPHTLQCAFGYMQAQHHFYLSR